MRPQIATKTGTGNSNVVVFDGFRNPFNVGIFCVVSGTVNYTVQHTSDWDDVACGVPSGATWFNHDDTALVSASSNQESNFAFPCKASRVVVNSGTGTVTVTYIQAGLMGG